MALPVKKVCVVGLGYVGLPLAVALGKRQEVIGFDINAKRLETLRKGVDYNRDVPPEELKKAKIRYTDNPKDIKEADFIIVAVPTPVNDAHLPDLSLLEISSRTVGENLRKRAIVVYESTVYPGVTEGFCAPILEKESGMKCGRDFKVGYSPERINPGDREHTIERIVKIVAGMDKESLETIAAVYGSIITAGVHKASSIKVAEAAKVIENTQRDINIALMNELKMIFDRMGIDWKEVLEAAGTKWNFLRFTPGLVGGHCIGVDPYYLAYEAERLGHHPEIILAGRRINDNMAFYEARRVIKRLAAGGTSLQGLKLLILGATFKPDINDLRNSKAEDVAKELASHGCVVKFHDPMIEREKVFGFENITLEQAMKEGFRHALLAVRHKALEKRLPELRKQFTLIELLR
jgi:UDP-N-acetyl-D-galactosamine dehydrogenase